MLLWLPPGSHKTQSFPHTVACSHVQQNLHSVQMVSPCSHLPFQVRSAEEQQAAICVCATRHRAHATKCAAAPRQSWELCTQLRLLPSSPASQQIKSDFNPSCLLFSGVLKTESRPRRIHIPHKSNTSFFAPSVCFATSLSP